MKQQRTFWPCRTAGLRLLVGLLAVGGLLWGAQPGLATNLATQCDGSTNDPDTCTGKGATSTNVCMGNLFAPTNPTSLNCTANDVRIAFADNVRDPVTNAALTSCFADSTLHFQADFHVETSGGVTRYDLGLYFSSDGDPNADGAKSGACSVSKIIATNSDKFINLDLPGNGGSQPTDSCGDIDDAHKPQTVTLTLSAVCKASALFFNPATGQCQTSNNGGSLTQHCMLLPNGVSWRQTGANDVCDSPLDAFPGTKSKCNANPAFGIPVIVEDGALTVTKTASPTSVPETGATATYTVKGNNTPPFVSVDITSLIDDKYGDLLDPSNPNVSDNTCPA